MDSSENTADGLGLDVSRSKTFVKCKTAGVNLIFSFRYVSVYVWVCVLAGHLQKQINKKSRVAPVVL